MAFENVNVTELKNSISECKNSINYTTTSSLIDTVSSSNIWQASSKNNLINSLICLKNERFKDLESTLDRYLEIVKYIEQYQKLDNENKKLFEKYSIIIQNVNSDFNTDDKILKELDLDKKNININKEQMEILKNNITNLI